MKAHRVYGVETWKGAPEGISPEALGFLCMLGSQNPDEGRLGPRF